jgi:PD-(D/E)XK nuclease superfamily
VSFGGHIVMADRDRSRSPRMEEQQPPLIVLFGEHPGDVITIEDLKITHRYDPSRAPERCISAKGIEIPNGTLCDWRCSDEEFRDDANFKWQDKALYEDSLSVVNATPRDARCVFVESTHVYTVDGKKVPWSGTTFSHYCEKHFDADLVLSRTKSGWARKKGYLREDDSEMNFEEIKSVWEKNGTSQSRRGTLLHWQIECYLNGYAIGGPHSPEFRMMLQFERAFMDALGLTPWRVEMNLFHCGLRLAGQADLICKDHSGNLVILDWKRSREIKEYGFNNEMQRPPLSHLPNANRHCYNLQLNTYRHILENEYGFVVSGMYLVVLHPDQVPAVPHVFKVPVLEAEIAALVRQVVEDKGVSDKNFPGPESAFDLSGTSFAEVR